MMTQYTIQSNTVKLYSQLLFTNKLHKIQFTTTKLGVKKNYQIPLYKIQTI